MRVIAWQVISRNAINHSTTFHWNVLQIGIDHQQTSWPLWIRLRLGVRPECDRIGGVRCSPSQPRLRTTRASSWDSLGVPESRRGYLSRSKCGRPSAVQCFCFDLREEIPATAATIALAAISASSRIMSGGIPMASRAIDPINSAVATAAIMRGNRSAVVIVRRRKGIFTGWLGHCRGMSKAVLDELGSPSAARVPRHFSRAGAPDAVEDPSPLSRPGG
jgi:hypothetical protein